MIYKTRERAEEALMRMVFEGRIQFGEYYIQEIQGGYELLPIKIFEYREVVE